MKLPRGALAPTRPRWLLLSALAFTVKAATLPCDCDDASSRWRPLRWRPLLLQRGAAAGGRPRDCTCVNGMKTYETTPKDDLLKMGKAGISQHLASCEKKREGLEEQKDYAIAESEVEVKKANKQMDKAKKTLSRVKNVTASDRAESREEKKTLMTDIDSLEKKLVGLNSKYNEQFTAWWKLKDAMTGKLEQTKKCKCKKKSSMLQRSRGALQNKDTIAGNLSPEQKFLYDTARKIDECETTNIKLSKEIKNAQQTGRKATIAAIEDQKKFGRSMADTQRLNRLMNQKPQVDKLKVTKDNLERTEKRRQKQVDDYVATNADIRKQLKTLDDGLKGCGCAA